MSAGEGFLTRWSRRKLDAPATPETPAADPAVPAAVDEAGPAIAEEPAVREVPEPEFDIASLPSLDTLTAESDISAFLAKGVPTALRNAAMRRMWSFDEALRHPDTLAEYAWNFNDPNAIVGFGEIGGAVDREAMLRQIMGRAPDPADATDPTSPDALETTLEPPAEPLRSIRREGEAVARPAPAADVATQDEREPEPDEGAADDSVETAGESLKVPSRARHGGALPE